MARPTKYLPAYNEQVEKLCKLGATDAQLADFFEVSESTVNKWKLDYPEFSESIKKGKEIADAMVAESLFHRAVGYSHVEEKAFCHQGEVVTHMAQKHYPPDATSAIFWLKNRRPDAWRDKREIGLDEDTLKALRPINEIKDIDHLEATQLYHDSLKARGELLEQ